MADQIDRKAYQRTLPRKRISAGCLLFDEAGRLLIVNPTYKDGWEIPGGVVEENESPLNGCIREIHEELGIVWRPRRLLAVDYNAESPQRTESLAFIFYGGILPPEIIAAIRLPARELSEHRFLQPDEAMALFKRGLRRRVSVCLPLIASGRMIYLEGQEPAWTIEST
ncbi:MAG TPA: NUDIX hydrolase [Promineifilum sp.]|nr:NUDIX hydrolase [Promineifilum sp.]